MATDLQDFSRTLFAAADQLWTNSTLRPDQYAQPVLALIALRQMEAKFEAVHAELAPQVQGPPEAHAGRLSGQGRDLPARERPLLAAARAARHGRPRGRAERGHEGHRGHEPRPRRARCRRATPDCRTTCCRSCCACSRR